MHKLRVLSIAFAAMTALGAGCAPATQEKSKVDYKQNPNATQAYRITMTIKDAPGPFASMKALAQYDVVNPECLPPPNSNPGGHTSPIPTKDVPIALTKVADGTYTGTIYADRMLDEDYHGRGVCRWKLIKARVHLVANGAPGETQFIPGITGEDVIALRKSTLYLAKDAYPRVSGVEDYPAFGREDRAAMGPEVKGADLFTVTFESSKDAP